MDFAPLVERFSEQQVLGFFLVLARVSPLFLLAPLFSSRSLPARAKGIVAIGLSVGLMPVAVKSGAGLRDVPEDAIGLAALIFKELLVGGAFAFALAALFAAVTAAGALLDTMVGFTFGALLDPMTGNQGGILTNLYTMVGIAVFIAIDGDAWVVKGLARTYDLVPLTSQPALGPLVAGTTTAFAGVLIAAVQVCAPVLLALVITDAGIGVVSKVMPSLNVFSVSFPAKVAVGLVLVGASLPFTAGWIHEELQQSVAAALSTLKVAG